MTLTERLRRKLVMSMAANADHLYQMLNDEREEAADALDAQAARIKELDGALRPIIEWHATPLGFDEKFGEAAARLDALVDRAREVLKK